MKKQTGIWLDQKQAFIIHFTNGKVSVQQLDSNIDDYRVVGGARSKTPWGPMDVVSEKKLLEKHKHQMNRYFKEIMSELKNTRDVYLFGPAETKFKLRDAIQNQKSLALTILKTDTADNMTEGQMVAQARKILKIKPTQG